MRECCKNYSPIVFRSTAAPAITTFNGGTHLFGNTEECLKHKVLSVPRRRGVLSMGPYKHREGTGYVPYHRGDYHDAIENGKSRVRLLVHESTFGGMSPYAAARLRRLGRLAATRGTDNKVDYTLSYTTPPRLLCRTTRSASRRPA